MQKQNNNLIEINIDFLLKTHISSKWYNKRNTHVCNIFDRKSTKFFRK